jgi:cell wall-associated NlpC family hydrolase
MIKKRIKRSKIALLIGLSILVLCIIGSGLLGVVKRLPERDKVAITKETIINPVKISVSLRDSLVSFGMKFLGTPYIAGGSGKNGFDCSGFVYFVFRHFNVQVPRSSSQFQLFGKEIPIDSVRKGDVLLFLSPTRNAIGHVGIVTNPKGKESDFIHASSGREMKVIITSLKQKRYNHRFVKAVNVL